MSELFHGLAPLAIIVMGVAGSGKSTLGVELAGAAGCPFLDGDAFHSPESIEKMRAGKPLTDEDRWPWLDRIGHGVEAAVAGSGVAVAACSALKRVYRDRLRQTIGFPVAFVFLDTGEDELRRRLTSRSGHYMPAGLLSSQIDTLENPQPDEPAIRLDAQQPPAKLCALVFEWLASRPQTKPR